MAGEFGWTLVRAAREERHEDHEVRQREKQLVRLFAGHFRGPRDKPQMAASREIADVIDANPREGRNFRVGEDFLAGLNCNHGRVPFYRLLHRAS